MDSAYSFGKTCFKISNNATINTSIKALVIGVKSIMIDYSAPIKYPILCAGAIVSNSMTFITSNLGFSAYTIECCTAIIEEA